MRVLIIEDEQSVAQNLCDILLDIDAEIEIITVLETVKDTVKWIAENQSPDLAFFDIKIADGNSFEIFEKTTVNFPIIFTTAYDEYALKAFKVNSIDYILKPIEKKALKNAIAKYHKLYKNRQPFDNEQLISIIKELKIDVQKKYKKSFLVYIKDNILPIATEHIAYFYIENKIVYCRTHTGELYYLDGTLDKIQNQLDPDDFFRVNRQFIIARKAIQSASIYFHRKLKLHVSPNSDSDILINKVNVAHFKKWLSGV